MLDGDPQADPGSFDTVQAFEVIEATVVISSDRESTESTERTVVSQNDHGDWKIWQTSTVL